MTFSSVSSLSNRQDRLPGISNNSPSASQKVQQQRTGALGRAPDAPKPILRQTPRKCVQQKSVRFSPKNEYRTEKTVYAGGPALPLRKSLYRGMVEAQQAKDDAGLKSSWRRLREGIRNCAAKLVGSHPELAKELIFAADRKIGLGQLAAIKSREVYLLKLAELTDKVIDDCKVRYCV